MRGGDTGRYVVVGYALEPKKVGSVIKPSLVRHARGRGIHFVAVDLNRSLLEQGPFHCLVHKLFDLNWQGQLLDFQSRHPDVPIIDPPSSILPLHNRISMLNAVTNIPQLQPHCFGIPNQVLFHNLTDFSCTIDFPVIAKPLASDDSAGCHEMSLVLDVQGLKKLQPPMMLQEFINHGGVLFKVYVAGNHVRCVKRASLPDVDQGGVEGGIIPFSRVSNLPIDDDRSTQENAGMPPLDLIQHLARGLGKELKLHLFNFDLIRDLRLTPSYYNRFVVIDINYFPGYAKLPEFETFLTDFFSDVTGLSNKKEAVDLGATQLRQATPDHIRSSTCLCL